MRTNKKNLIILIASLVGVLLLLYFFFLRDLVQQAYEGTAPVWFNLLIQTFYPRFIVEKQRFDLAFFLRKTDQIVVRTSFAAIILILLIYFKEKYKTFRDSNENFWNTRTSRNNVSILRILYFVFMFLIFKDIYSDLLELSKAKSFYQPIFIYKLLGIGFPSDSMILIIYLVLVLSCLSAALNIFPVASSILAILNFIFIQGIIFSFEKTDHGFATFTYAGMIMPFLLLEHKASKRQSQTDQKSWPLQLILILISAGYLFSGLEKIFISQLQWLYPDTVRNYLLLHQAPLGLWVASHPVLCIALPWFTLIFQLGFILAVFRKRWRYVFLPAGILFHISTYFLFNVGGFLNPWMMTYIFFIDWTKTYHYIHWKTARTLNRNF